MKRSPLVAGALTIILHILALGCLSLWSIESGEVAHALEAPPGTTMGQLPPSSVPTHRDTVTPAVVPPDEIPAVKDSTEAAQPPKEITNVAPRPAERTKVTPILMLSWQKGGGRRKTAGALPTLTGPLASDVSSSFKVMVAPDGTVRSVRVVKSKNVAFERTAVTRIRQWKFEPLRTSRPADQLCLVTLKAKAR